MSHEYGNFVPDKDYLLTCLNFEGTRDSHESSSARAGTLNLFFARARAQSD